MALFSVVMIVAVLAIAATARADVVMPSAFGDHMVLQQEKSLPVWGTASPGERVTVRIAGRDATTIADADGRWRVEFEPLSPIAEPIDVRIVGDNEIVLRDVLVGDVWLCSGQSNMEWTLEKSFEPEEAIREASLKRVRLFVVGKRLAFSPQDDCAGKWVVCTPESAAQFSAVGFYFGRAIHRHLDRPVGLIGSYWGGTRAEGWTSRAGLSKDAALADLVETFDDRRKNLVALRKRYLDELLPAWERAEALAKSRGEPAPQHPYLEDPVTPHQGVVLHNGMIAPLGPMALRGVIWYQGESNDHRSDQYRRVFGALIDDWRSQFGDPALPFLFVQLATHRERKPEPSHHAWCTIREAQAQASTLPATAMISAIDVGEVYNIHPLNKRTIGERLATAARGVAFGERVEWSGPTYREMRVEEGGRVRIQFDHIGGGLVTATPATQPSHDPPRPTDELRGFAIAGSDRVFHWAQARIDGDDVVVWSDRVNAPVAVRYGWASNPDVTLYSRKLLPAVPFRTDDWDVGKPC